MAGFMLAFFMLAFIAIASKIYCPLDVRISLNCIMTILP